MQITESSITQFLQKGGSLNKDKTKQTKVPTPFNFTNLSAPSPFSVEEEMKKENLQNIANTLGSDYVRYASTNTVKSGDIDKVKAFYESYLNSPNYKKRLEAGGYDPSTLTKRKANLANLKFTHDKNDSTGYLARTNTINLSDYLTPGTIAHEVSHALGAIGPQGSYKAGPNKNYTTLSEKDNKSILRVNRLLRNDFDLGLYQPDPELGEYRDPAIPAMEHATKPEENKADMDAFRFQLKQDGIYDTGTQEFNQDILNKVKNSPKYKNNFIFNRLFNSVGDSDLVRLMNTIASTNKPASIGYAQKGGLISRDNTRTNLNISKTSPAINTSDHIKERADFKGGMLSKFVYGQAGDDNSRRAKGHGDGYDFYRYYYGQPLATNKLRNSMYKPTKAKDPNAQYIAFNDENFQNDIVQLANDNPKGGPISGYNIKRDGSMQQRKGVKATNGDGTKMATASLGGLIVTQGSDKQGDFVSYYDMFDEGTGSAQSYSEIGGIAKPYEVYDRIYVNKDASGKLSRKEQPAYKTHNTSLRENLMKMFKK